MDCDGCTECCNAFPVIELEKEACEVCEHADNGCQIYSERPESCRKCECAYFQSQKATIDLRPDKCGVIFERSGRTMVGTIVGPIKNIVRGQSNAFVREGFRVVFQDKDGMKEI